MKLYKHEDITVAAGKEGTEAILTSSAKEKFRVLNIAIERTPTNDADATATPDFNDLAEVDLLVYVEREKVAQLPTNLIPREIMWIPLDVELPLGQSLEVGLKNGTVGEVIREIAIQYELM